MGLDVSAGRLGYRIGSYSYFNNWRNTVFKLINKQNVDVTDFFGFGGDNPRLGDLDFFFINDSSITRPIYRDLRYIINHSDSDGEITLQECRRLFPALKMFVEEFYDGRKIIEANIGNDKVVDLKSLIETAVKFINLCAAAEKYKENMEFH